METRRARSKNVSRRTREQISYILLYCTVSAIKNHVAKGNDSVSRELRRILNHGVLGVSGRGRGASTVLPFWNETFKGKIIEKMAEVTKVAYSLYKASVADKGDHPTSQARETASIVETGSAEESARTIMSSVKSTIKPVESTNARRSTAVAGSAVNSRQKVSIVRQPLHTTPRFRGKVDRGSQNPVDRLQQPPQQPRSRL